MSTLRRHGRMSDDNRVWELATNGLPEAPAIRAIVVHPQQPGTVYVGTQYGPYKSVDHGDHWEKVAIPDHGLAVWSLLFHPTDAKYVWTGNMLSVYRAVRQARFANFRVHLLGKGGILNASLMGFSSIWEISVYLYLAECKASPGIKVQPIWNKTDEGVDNASNKYHCKESQLA